MKEYNSTLIVTIMPHIYILFLIVCRLILLVGVTGKEQLLPVLPLLPHLPPLPPSAGGLISASVGCPLRVF